MDTDSPQSSLVQRWLNRTPGPLFVTYAILASFTTYFCMYAFRKPYTAATFKGEEFAGTAVELKTALIISQIIGYALSKFIGIKFCSEVKNQHRALSLLVLVGVAELALVAYGMLPHNWKVAAIFFNGLPLGMIWGLVVRYLEGRRTSELLLAGLSCSFIVSSGVVKDFGRALMQGVIASWWEKLPWVGALIGRSMGEVSESWMPAITGLHFLPLFLLAVWMLNQLPLPDAADQAARTTRSTMDRKERLAFVKQFAFGITLLCLAYLFLTAYRDFRDNFMVELYNQLGYPYEDNMAIISKTEFIVAFGVMIALALLNTIKNNIFGLVGAYAVMTCGVLMLGAGTLLLQTKMISGFWWMTLIGLGSYLAYVPYGSILFDRLIASTRVVGTAVFAIYLADAIGYTGSVGVMLFKDFAQGETTRLAFFKNYTWFMCFLGAICLISSCVYFLRQARKARQLPPHHASDSIQPATSTQ